MRIQICEKYFLETDPLNYTLQERKLSPKYKSKKDEEEGKINENYGKESFSDIGHYPNLSILINGMIENRIKTSQHTEISALRADIDNLIKYLENNVNSIVKDLKNGISELESKLDAANKRIKKLSASEDIPFVPEEGDEDYPDTID